MHSTDYAVVRCMSVYLSVWLSVTCRYSVGTVIHILKVFSPSSSPTILVFPYQMGWYYCNGDPLMGASNARGMKKSRFLTNISLSFRNDTRQSHSYYGRQIGTHTQAFEWYQFEWPSVTYNPDFKVTIIQKQVTRKWYNTDLNLRWPTDGKSYMIYRRTPFSMTLNDPYPMVLRSFHSLITTV